MFTFENWMTLQKWNWGICLVLLLLFRKQYKAFFQRFASKAQSAEGRFCREFLLELSSLALIFWPMILYLLLELR